LVFYFIFVGVGFVLFKERRAEQARKKQADREAAQRPRRRPDRIKDQMPVVG